MSTTHDDAAGSSGLIPTFIIGGLLLASFGWTVLANQGPSAAHGHGAAVSGAHGRDAAHAELAFPAMSIDRAALVKSQQQRYSQPESLLQSPKIAQFIKQANEQLDHQFTTQPIPSKTVEELTQAHEYHLGESLTEVSDAKNLMRVADLFVQRCEPALYKIMEAVQNKTLSMDQAIKDPDIGQWQPYRQWCGDLLGALAQFKLIDTQANWSAPWAKDFVPVILRHRFADSLVAAAPKEALLSPLELTLYWRWRIEQPASFTLEQRQEALNKADKALLPYHWLKAQALLQIEANQLENAQKTLHLLQVQQPKAAYIQTWIDGLSKGGAGSAEKNHH